MARASRSPGERAASEPTSFTASPGHTLGEEHSAPASYAKQFAIKTPNWLPKAAQKS